MSKQVKDLMTQEYHESYGEVASACVVSVVGLDAVSNNRFRGQLRAKNIDLRVVKNSLMRRATVDSPLAPLSKALDGPCALVTGGDSIIDVAKLLVDMKKAYPAIELKQGMLEGDPDLVSVEEMSKFKSKAELLGDIAGLIASPGRRLAGCLASPGGKIAGCLKAMADKEGEGGEAEAA